MTNDKDSAVLEPCGHCGEQCATLVIDQGDKWAHYEPSCLEVRTGYDLSDDAPWRAEAIAAWNTRQPTQSDALREENERLRALLARTVNLAEVYAEGTGTNFKEAMAEARAALQEQSK